MLELKRFECAPRDIPAAFPDLSSATIPPPLILLSFSASMRPRICNQRNKKGDLQ